MFPYQNQGVKEDDGDRGLYGNRASANPIDDSKVFTSNRKYHKRRSLRGQEGDMGMIGHQPEVFDVAVTCGVFPWNEAGCDVPWSAVAPDVRVSISVTKATPHASIGRV